MKIHSIFQPPPPPVIIDEDGEPEYEVDETVDSKFVGTMLKHLVHWVGYSELTWEPADNGCQENSIRRTSTKNLAKMNERTRPYRLLHPQPNTMK